MQSNAIVRDIASTEKLIGNNNNNLNNNGSPGTDIMFQMEDDSLTQLGSVFQSAYQSIVGGGGQVRVKFTSVKEERREINPLLVESHRRRVCVSKLRRFRKKVCSISSRWCALVGERVWLPVVFGVCPVVGAVGTGRTGCASWKRVPFQSASCFGSHRDCQQIRLRVD